MRTIIHSLQASRVEIVKAEMNREFLVRMVDRLDYPALLEAAQQVPLDAPYFSLRGRESMSGSTNNK